MKNNFKKEILDRAMIALNCKKVNEIATLLNISPQNLNGYLDRGTFIKFASSEFYKRKINIDWIKSGQGSMKIEHGTIGEISPPHSASPSDTIPVRISDLLSKTAAILESQTTYATALKSNIVAFHYAMTCEEQLDLANKRIDTLEDHVKAIESRLLKVNESS